jgi:hypothetical protein
MLAGVDAIHGEAVEDDPECTRCSEDTMRISLIPRPFTRRANTLP